MGQNIWDRIKATAHDWRLGDYFRQFSIVAAGIIVTFWGSDKITERSRQKEVWATMQLVAEELEYNRKELREVKRLLDIDRHMSSVLLEHNMDIYDIPEDTLEKYGKLFSNLSEFSYRADALDVLKGSSLMQYIPDKRLLQNAMQPYFQLGRIKKDVDDYYQVKTDVLMSIIASKRKTNVSAEDDDFRNNILFLIDEDRFVNFVVMAPGFLYWGEFDELDEMLGEQIEVLEAKYK